MFLFHKVWQENEFESDDVFESISAFKKKVLLPQDFYLGLSATEI